MFKYESFLRLLNQTSTYKAGSIGEVLMDPGYFANVIRISPSLGLAVTCDGVGTKVLIAQEMQKFDTIGIDCIAMNVNDLLCVGAEPITFLDYMALEYPHEDLKMDLAKGLLKGATLSEISVCGGETAIVPDLIKGVRRFGFDLAGVGIGVIDPSKIIDGRDIQTGDLIIGLHSNGLHSNGYTLVRKIIESKGWDYRYTHLFECEGRVLGEVLLEPTIIYVPVVKEMLRTLGSSITALINITGGGLLNLLRTVNHMNLVIDYKFDKIPPIFNVLQEVGELSSAETFNNFNMGIGFCVFLSPNAYETLSAICSKYHIAQSIIGHVVGPGRGLEILSRNLVVKDSEFISG